MEIKDVLRDAVNTINGIGFDVIVAGRNDDGKLTMDAVTADRQVIMKAVVKDDVTDMEGVEAFGIGALGILQGLMNLGTYKTESTKIAPVIQDGELKRFVFNSDDASTEFVVISPKALPKQPKYIDKGFEVQVTPSAAKVQELKSFAGVLKTISEAVQPYTENGQLRFKVGTGNKANHGGSIAFTQCSVDLNAGYSYPVDRIMQCLSRMNSCKECSINISTRGVLAVSVDTGVVQYNFYMMGK